MRIVLLLLPWLELFTLIELGIKTGALTALAYVFATALIGLMILQRQGRGMFERLRRGRTGMLTGPGLLLDDMGMAFAALLLIFPGMITDVIAVLVAIGPLRRRMLRAFSRDGSVDFDGGGNGVSRDAIEGEYRRIDDEEPP
jgi:UPF0716 protein FxsA